MADYTSRAAELNKEIDELQPKLNEDAVKRMRQAVSDYAALREACLDELVTIVSDQSESTRDTASRWTSRCDSMRGSIAQPFDNQIKSIAPPEALSAALAWQGKAITDEDKFFSTLASINAASTRDYLVANQASLKEYAKTLDEKWKKITGEEDKLHADEQKAYAEMLDLVRKVVRELGDRHKTALEKIRSAQQEATDFLKIDKMADALLKVGGVKIQTLGSVIKVAAQTVGFYNQIWLDTNPAIMARMANIRALIQAEKGGILPLFKETRKQVAEYWEKNGIDRAKNMVSGARSSLDSWLSSCPTSAQRDDAKRFYDEAYGAIEKHIKVVEDAASEFEKRWNGVFKGPLSSSVADDLVDAVEWKANARTLVEAGTFASLEDLKEQMAGGYYDSSFEDSLVKMREMVATLPEGVRAEPLAMVDALKKEIETTVRDRVLEFQKQIAGSLDWFQPSALEKALDHDELKNDLN